MVTVLPTDDLVVDVIESEARLLMFQRSKLIGWMNRARRAEMLREIEALLDQWLDLTR